jgi:hypothetical protein
MRRLSISRSGSFAIIGRTATPRTVRNVKVYASELPDILDKDELESEVRRLLRRLLMDEEYALSKDSETIVGVKHHGRSVDRLDHHFIIDNLPSVAKPDEPADLIMPEIGLKLLPFIVPKKLRDAVMGDLTEDFRTFAARWGRSYASHWLWWELAGLCIRRFGLTAIVMGIGAWFRQKLGW